MLCINTFGRVRYFPDQAKKKIQNGRTSTLNKMDLTCQTTRPNMFTEPCHENPVFGVSEQVQHKPGCAATDYGISDKGNRGILLFFVVKTKVLIGSPVTAQLICVFVFCKQFLL